MNLPLIMEDFRHLTEKKHVWVMFLRNQAWLSSLAVTRSLQPRFHLVTLFLQAEVWMKDISPMNLCTPMIVDFNNGIMVYFH